MVTDDFPTRFAETLRNAGETLEDNGYTVHGYEASILDYDLLQHSDAAETPEEALENVLDTAADGDKLKVALAGKNSEKLSMAMTTSKTSSITQSVARSTLRTQQPTNLPNRMNHSTTKSLASKPSSATSLTKTMAASKFSTNRSTRPTP